MSKQMTLDAPVTYRPSFTQNLVASLSKAYNRNKIYRNTLAELRGLSDRELSDLGLNSTMLKSIAQEAANAAVK